MKRLLLAAFSVSALFLSSCSSTKLAQTQDDDDVYFTKAKAKEVSAPVYTNSEEQQPKQERSYRTDEQLYGDEYSNGDRYYNDDYYYDYGYASRLNRFYGRSPWRTSYYDSWYSYSYNPWYTYRYDPFYYDPWYYRGGVNVWVGIGSPRYGCYGCYDYGYYYGYPYGGNYWGPYSYYNVYPSYGYGGYYGGGYYSGRTYNNPNYRTRPNRETGMGRANAASPDSRPGLNGTVGGTRPNRGTYSNGGSVRTGGTSSAGQSTENNAPVYSRPSRGTSTSTPEPSGTTQSVPAERPTTRPSRGSDSNTQGTTTQSAPAERQSTRPSRGNDNYQPQSRPAERSYTPPPSYDSGRSSGGSSNGGSSSGGSSSGGGGGRPSRGGR